MKNNGLACLFLGIIIGSVLTMIFTLNDEPSDIAALLLLVGVVGWFVTLMCSFQD